MKILNFGSLNIDKVYKVKHFVRPGETIFSEEYQCFPGGKGLNQSIAAARAGVPVYHAGTIGPDGRFLAELLKESGVDTRYLRENGSITGHALIQVSEEGENCIILFNGSNYENSREFIDQVLEDFGQGDILVLQNEISNLPYLLEKGNSMGMRILFNPSPMNESLKKTDLSGVNWLMLNETEGNDIIGSSDPDRITEILLENYPQMKVILTLGQKGAVYKSAEECVYQPCFPVNAVDTTAAGDTFTGYFIAAVVEGKTMQDALRLAACASSITVSREGAAVSIPERALVDERLRELDKGI